LRGSHSPPSLIPSPANDLNVVGSVAFRIIDPVERSDSHPARVVLTPTPIDQLEASVRTVRWKTLRAECIELFAAPALMIACFGISAHFAVDLGKEADFGSSVLVVVDPHLL